MSTLDRVREIVAPLVTEAGLRLYDVEMNRDVLRVTVQGPEGTDLDDLARLSRELSGALDDADPITGRYTLEVSSPGLERTLRRPEHYLDAVGETVSVKTRPGTEGARRVRGVLTAADDEGVTVRLDPDAGSDAPGEADGGLRRLAYDDITKAATVFDWGPADRPGSPRPSRKAAS